MRVIFENATIADSIAKASRVAPTKGEAFDKASGILMTLDPEEKTVTLRSTNLMVFYLEVVDAIEVEGEGEWRLNASLLRELTAKLPIGSGKNVVFEDKDGGEVIIRSGNTRARFRKMDASYFPTWKAFDPDKLDIVPDFGARIKQVEWAALDDFEASIGGIHLNGESAVATNRFVLAVVPCEAEPIYKPITIPASVLKPVLTNLRDVAIGIDEGRFLLMPDTSTQISTRIFDKEYPDVLKAMRDRTWPTHVSVRKNTLLEIMERAMIFAQRDRSPQMTFMIGKSKIAVMCSDADLGLLGDSIDLDDGVADHSLYKILFTPNNLREAIQAAPSEVIDIFYDPENSNFPFKIDGGSGYTALVMPRREMEGGSGGS
jgi:DNA polymerase III sliding clamp (beta) subunit (PCNA family)